MADSRLNIMILGEYPVLEWGVAQYMTITKFICQSQSLLFFNCQAEHIFLGSVKSFHIGIPLGVVWIISGLLNSQGFTHIFHYLGFKWSFLVQKKDPRESELANDLPYSHVHGSGESFDEFMRASVTTRTYVFVLSARGSGPGISMETWSQGPRNSHICNAVCLYWLGHFPYWYRQHTAHNRPWT